MLRMKTKHRVHFPGMKKMVGESDSRPSPFAGYLQTFLVQFKKRFQQFTVIEPIVGLYNFTCQTEVTETAASIRSLILAAAEEANRRVWTFRMTLF
jgi:hypothetical protein